MEPSMITPAVAAHLSSLRTGDFPAYVYDLAALDDHLSRIRTALPPQVELYYAIKANSDLPVVRTIAGHATGLEVASGGELAHLVASDVQCPITFGGPAKTEDDLRAALRHGVHRIHV
jgi:diaminopimelate decarboxylase